MISIIKNKIHSLNGILKSVIVLITGTAFAHLIFICTLPIITRLYNPDDFKSLAVYSSILSIVGVLVCLRFEIAIPLPKSDKHATILAVLALISTLIVNFLVFLVLFICQGFLRGIIDPNVLNYYWLIPLGGIFIGLYNTFQYWATRKKEFMVVAKTRLIQMGFSSFFQIVYGLISPVFLGLILGYIIKISAGFFIIGRFFFKENIEYLRKINSLKLIAVFKKYKKFPKYSVWEGVLNASSIQVPILLIAFYSVGPEVGFLMLASQLLSAPMSLIGQSVAQVYLSEAGKRYQENNLNKFTHEIIINLIKVGAIPMLLGFFLFPYFIPVFLGGEWSRVGVMMSWMIPWFFMQFITSPISMSLHVTNNQKVALFLQLFGFVFRAGSVVVAGLFFSDFIFETYAVSGFLFYCLYLFTVLGTLNKS